MCQCLAPAVQSKGSEPPATKASSKRAKPGRFRQRPSSCLQLATGLPKASSQLLAILPAPEKRKCSWKGFMNVSPRLSSIPAGYRGFPHVDQASTPFG